MPTSGSHSNGRFGKERDIKGAQRRAETSGLVREAEAVGVTTAGAADGPAEGQLTGGPWFPWRAGRMAAAVSAR